MDIKKFVREYGGVFGAVGMAVALAALLLVAVRPEEPVARTYGCDVYTEQGCSKFVVASGGEIEAQSGATVDIQSGATVTMPDVTFTGTVQAEHLYSTDDAVISDALTAGSATVTGTVQAEHIYSTDDAEIADALSAGSLTVTGTASAAGITSSDGLTVSSGSVDFPSASIADEDLNLSLVAGDMPSSVLNTANIATVCAGGNCDYTSVETALETESGTAATPAVVWVMPGSYTDSGPVDPNAYVYLFGSGEELTTWTVTTDENCTWDDGPGGVVDITTNIDSHLTTDNFYCRDATLISDSSNALFANDSSNARLELWNCTLWGQSESSKGLDLNAFYSVEMHGCVITGSHTHSVVGVAISMNSVATSTFAMYDSVIYGEYHGILFNNEGTLTDTFEVYNSVVEGGTGYAINTQDTFTGTVCGCALGGPSGAFHADFATDCTSSGANYLLP